MKYSSVSLLILKRLQHCIKNDNKAPNNNRNRGQKPRLQIQETTELSIRLEGKAKKNSSFVGMSSRSK